MDMEQMAKEIAEQEKLKQEQQKQENDNLPANVEKTNLPSTETAPSFENMQNKFLNKKLEQGASLNEIATDFAKAKITSDILNDDSERGQKYRDELAKEQKETIKESFRQDKVEQETNTLVGKQAKAEAFYKSVRPILEFDFTHLIERKDKQDKNNSTEVKPKTYADRSYGIPLMVCMLIVLTIPYFLVSLILAIFNGVNAILQEINNFGRIAKWIALSIFIILVAVIVIYIAICGVEALFGVGIIHR